MKQWKVGTITLGITLILIGILWLYSQIAGIPLSSSVLKWWPLILIMLGIEVLIFSIFPRNQETTVKFSGVSIFLLVLIDLCFGIYQFITIGLGFISENMPIRYQYNQSVTVERVFSRDNKELLFINQNAGSIAVDISSDDKIYVEATVKYRGSNSELEKEKIEKVFVLKEDKIFKIDSDLLSDGNEFFTVDYRISIPKGMSVEAYNSLGRTNIENIQGSVTVEGSAGTIAIANIQGEVKIINELGLIEARDIKGKTYLESSSGSIRYISKEVVTEDVTINNNLGTISLTLNKEQQGVFKCNTSLGSIESELPLRIQGSGAAKHIDDSIGEASTLFTVKADSGSIKIEN